MNMYILLKDVKFYARHGVDPQETAVGAVFTVNLKIKTDFTHALQTDNLEGTLNYAEVYQAVKDEMEQPSKLLEHVGGRIVKRLFNDFACIESIELELLKQNPPMGADCEGAGIFLSVSR